MIKLELLNSTQKRMDHVLVKSISWEALMFIIVGISGYFSTMDGTPSLIINRPKIPGTGDYLMLIGRLGICLKVFTSIALNLIPCRR